MRHFNQSMLKDIVEDCAVKILRPQLTFQHLQFSRYSNFRKASLTNQNYNGEFLVCTPCIEMPSGNSCAESKDSPESAESIDLRDSIEFLDSPEYPDLTESLNLPNPQIHQNPQVHWNCQNNRTHHQNHQINQKAWSRITRLIRF